ncbi:unnamed protein product [Owenia fusiformis]|uniref:Uncharacterized protein n=1 Tax=Owenia fusiformis TaxID=6347 RepID=A0A8J1XNT8_OWEFU|nr:unnamed protein product [Owenia fusiformis]
MESNIFLFHIWIFTSFATVIHCAMCSTKVGRPPGKLASRATNQVYLMLNNTFRCDGVITAWHYYRVNSISAVFAGVWRHPSNAPENYYHMVGQNLLPPAGKGLQSVYIPPSKQIEVREGDFLGIHHSWKTKQSPVAMETNETTITFQSDLYMTVRAGLYNENMQTGVLNLNLHDRRVTMANLAMQAEVKNDAEDGFITRIVCNKLPFTVNCGDGRIIVIKSALYGRIENQCEVTIATQCNPADVRQKLSKMCAGKRSCEVQVDSARFGNPCSGEENLEVKYKCLAEAFVSYECNEKNITIYGQQGYLASPHYATTYRQPVKNQFNCSWNIYVKPGQQINLKLLDFDTGIVAHDHQGDSQCMNRLTVNDHVNHPFAECANNLLSDIVVLSSSANLRLITTLGRNNRGVLIYYEAIGCPFLKPPINAAITRLRREPKNTVIVLCDSTFAFLESQVQGRVLRCEGTQWNNTVGECVSGSVIRSLTTAPTSLATTVTSLSTRTTSLSSTTTSLSTTTSITSPTTETTKTITTTKGPNPTKTTQATDTHENSISTSSTTPSVTARPSPAIITDSTVRIEKQTNMPMYNTTLNNMTDLIIESLTHSTSFNINTTKQPLTESSTTSDVRTKTPSDQNQNSSSFGTLTAFAIFNISSSTSQPHRPDSTPVDKVEEVTTAGWDQTPKNATKEQKELEENIKLKGTISNMSDTGKSDTGNSSLRVSIDDLHNTSIKFAAGVLVGVTVAVLLGGVALGIFFYCIKIRNRVSIQEPRLVQSTIIHHRLQENPLYQCSTDSPIIVAAPATLRPHPKVPVKNSKRRRSQNRCLLNSTSSKEEDEYMEMGDTDSTLPNSATLFRGYSTKSQVNHNCPKPPLKKVTLKYRVKHAGNLPAQGNPENADPFPYPTPSCYDNVYDDTVAPDDNDHKLNHFYETLHDDPPQKSKYNEHDGMKERPQTPDVLKNVLVQSNNPTHIIKHTGTNHYDDIAFSDHSRSSTPSTIRSSTSTLETESSDRETLDAVVDMIENELYHTQNDVTTTDL